MGEAPAGSPAALLLVEDEPANRALVHAIVARAVARDVGRYELSDAVSLSDARRVLGTQPFRALLLDVRLPDGSGLDLVSEARGRSGVRPWVVVMSASVHAEDRQRALAAGADLFLGKPIDARQLIEILGRIAREAPPPDGPP